MLFPSLWAHSANEEAELGLFNSVANSSGVGEFWKEVKFWISSKFGESSTLLSVILEEVCELVRGETYISILVMTSYRQDLEYKNDCELVRD